MKYNEISDLYKFYTTILKGSRSWKQILFSKHSLDEVEYCRVKYNEWKQYALEEFDKIEDKEHLKLWLKEKQILSQHYYDSVAIVFSIIATVVIIEYAKYCIEHLSELVVTHIIIAISLLLAMIICVCMFGVFLLRRMQFYQHCLELLK